MVKNVISVGKSHSIVLYAKLIGKEYKSGVNLRINLGKIEVARSYENKGSL